MDIKDLFCVCDESRVFFVKPVTAFQPGGYFIGVGPRFAAMFDERDTDLVIKTFSEQVGKKFIKMSAAEMMDFNPELNN